MKSIYKPIGNRGFTLIEVLIAGFLLVTAILGVISTTVIIIKSNSLSKTMTTATTLAKDKMEQSKNTGYGSLAESTDYCIKDSTYPWPAPPAPFCQPTSTADSIYTRRQKVYDNTPAADMKTIEVTVQWNWQSTPHSVILTTSVAK